MEHINNPLLGRQIGEVYKWLCFLNYICLQTDKKFANRLDDIQYILEAVSANKDPDLSETAGWWERYYENENCNEYATNLIKNIRSAGRDSRLNLPPHKRKSLSFYLAEFRGLSLSLRAARDSAEHHISQGENKDLFSSLYGAMALRVFEISKLLANLVNEIAVSNPKETTRFNLRIVTASETELTAYKEISKNLPAIAITGQSSINPIGAFEDNASLITDLLDESEGRIIEQLQVLREEILVGVDQSRQELVATLTQAIPDPKKIEKRNSKPLPISAPEPSGNPSLLNQDQLFSELLGLRGRIYTAMSSKIDGFEHWHNILQKPIIAEICKSGCRDYDSVKSLPGFKSRILQMNKGFALNEQEQEFSTLINQILSRSR
jgi:hypothetical protein